MAGTYPLGERIVRLRVSERCWWERIYLDSWKARENSHYLIDSYTYISIYTFYYTSSFLLFDMPRSRIHCIIDMDRFSTRAHCRRVHKAPFCYSISTVQRAPCGELPTRVEVCLGTCRASYTRAHCYYPANAILIYNCQESLLGLVSFSEPGPRFAPLLRITSRKLVIRCLAKG